MRKPVRIALFAVAAFGLPALACGAASTAPSAPAAGPKVVVTINKDSQYAPTSLEIVVGTTVMWKNEDRYQHTSTHAPTGEIKFNADHSFDLTGAEFNVIEDENGGSGSFTFTKPGTYQYFCLWHNAMRATVIVTAAQ